jgi:hypothetical protein
MKKGDTIIVNVDGDIRSATVIDMLKDGRVLTSIRDYYGDYVEFTPNNVCLASEYVRSY